jgi:hypothetical protein
MGYAANLDGSLQTLTNFGELCAHNGSIGSTSRLEGEQIGWQAECSF